LSRPPFRCVDVKVIDKTQQPAEMATALKTVMKEVAAKK
jgi:hypothetical protein